MNIIALFTSWKSCVGKRVSVFREHISILFTSWKSCVGKRVSVFREHISILFREAPKSGCFTTVHGNFRMVVYIEDYVKWNICEYNKTDRDSRTQQDTIYKCVQIETKWRF